MRIPEAVVVDTNVFVSSFLSPGGAPRGVVNLWRDGRIRLALCAEIVEEYVEVLVRIGFAGRKELGALLDLFRLRRGIVFVVIDGDLRAVPSDPDDDKFIECALAAGARTVVSGDRHLLRVGTWGTVRVLSHAAFLDTVSSP